MNRNNEYNELIQELEAPPLKLDFTLDRARSKKMVRDKHHRVKNLIFVPLGTIAAIFLIFSALVNFYSPFAKACDKIPVLSELAEDVSLSPSLCTDIKNWILR